MRASTPPSSIESAPETGDPIELRELRYFVALAEERHFGRAAKRLYIAQSGLSKAIIRTESELGVALFTRTSHTVELTDAGAALLARAHGVLAGFEALHLSVEAARTGHAGSLSVAITPVVRHHTAPAIFARFIANHPDVRLDRRELISTNVVDDLAAGELDLGITVCPPVREGLCYERIKDTSLRLLISSSHPLARRSAVALGELSQERFLMSGAAARPEVQTRLAPLFALAGFRPRWLRERVDYDDDLHMVREARGVRLSARSFLNGAPPGISVLELDPSASLPVQVVWRDQAPSPIVSRFLENVRRVAREEGWSSPSAAGELGTRTRGRFPPLPAEPSLRAVAAPRSAPVHAPGSGRAGHAARTGP